MTQQIIIINESTVLPDSSITTILPVLQTQVSRDIVAHWNVDCILTFDANNKVSHPMAWQLVILDDTDQGDNLGYHELTMTGQPQARVFAKTDLDSNASIPVSVSHELLEMLVNPFLNRFDDSNGTYTLVEICDAVAGDSSSYQINGINVSDFVFPSYFNGAIGPYDFTNQLSGPVPNLVYGGLLTSYQNGQWIETRNFTSQDRAARSWRRKFVNNKMPMRRSTR